MKKDICILLLLVLLFVSNLQAAEKGPTADLQPILHDLTGILADESLKGDEHRTKRREKIMSLITHGFDFGEMSKRVLGKTWQDIGEKERDNFTRLMTKLLENVYIGKLESFSGQTLEYIGENIKEDRGQVSVLLDNAGVKIPIYYIMRKTDARWMVYDINIEGVSLVRNYQEQFKSIIRKDNYEGLVKVMEEKISSFSTELK
ncbi:MAG: ABC transporter substrate-binding protein [Proteobacteria bacterium]|nr:ABC transporter substrate-binding protein [Pseudomonadota bacterium]